MTVGAYLKTCAPIPEARRAVLVCAAYSRGGTIMRMQTVVVLFIGLLLNGCSLFGGGKNTASGLDLAAMQRAQWGGRARSGGGEAGGRRGRAGGGGGGPGRT